MEFFKQEEKNPILEFKEVRDIVKTGNGLEFMGSCRKREERGKAGGNNLLGRRFVQYKKGTSTVHP